MTRPSFPAVLLLAAVGCNVEPIQDNTGGVPAPDPPGDGRCPEGLTVLLSDFLSTQIALSASDGTTLSPSFLSTSSARTDGLAFALSGDVVLPGERTPSGRVVLIDRYGTNVLTFADPRTARVLGQIPVSTGYEANPYDYIEVDDRRAYVSRFGHNVEPGRQPFDAGDDVLIVDTEEYAIVGRIPLGEPLDVAPPRPTHFARIGADILVTLERASLDFESQEESELVAIDPGRDAVSWRMTLSGLKGCGGAELSSDGRALFMACSGSLSVKGNVEDLSASGLIVLDVTMTPPVELRRVMAADLAAEAIQSELAVVDDRVVLFKTQTGLAGASNNRLLTWDVESGDVTELLEARPDAKGRGLGIVYGALACDPGCSNLCWMADADRGVLQRIVVTDGRPAVDGQVRVESRVGLPPRGLTYR